MFVVGLLIKMRQLRNKLREVLLPKKAGLLKPLMKPIQSAAIDMKATIHWSILTVLYSKDVLFFFIFGQRGAKMILTKPYN